MISDEELQEWKLYVKVPPTLWQERTLRLIDEVERLRGALENIADEFNYEQDRDQFGNATTPPFKPWEYAHKALSIPQKENTDG